MTRFSATLRAAAAACLFVAGAGIHAQPAPSPADDALASLQAAYARSVAPGEEADRYRTLMAAVVRRVQRSYVVEADFPAFSAAALRVLDAQPAQAGEPAEVFRKSVNAALRTLDANSRYMDAQAHGNERSDSGDSFVGVGLELDQGGTGAGIGVIASLPGSPAARAGLRRGDLIVRIDEHPLQGVALSEAIGWIRGAAGTPVTLTVRRAEGVDEFTVSITRDTIRRQALTWSMEGDVLLLRLRSFTPAVAASMEQAIAQASAAQLPRAVVLDMRGNPGGLLREAVQVADAFLAKGDIVSLRGRAGSNARVRQADANEVLAGVAMVVLIDGRSASASELVAAALRDNGRATVMGQRSYGKGSVQTTFPLGEMGALKLTTAHYLAPSGRAVHRIGVAPEIQLVTGRGDPAAKALEVEDPWPAPKARIDASRCPQLPPPADAALSCAVAYLRAGDAQSFLERIGK